MRTHMMYLLDEDVASLCRMLDSDPDIALIRPDGDQRWKAHREIPTLPDGEHAPWHIPSGPIILEPKPPTTRVKRVKNPFAGWTEIVSFQKGEPWFGLPRSALSGFVSAASPNPQMSLTVLSPCTAPGKHPRQK